MDRDQVREFLRHETDVEALRGWVNIPNKPDCSPEVIALNLSLGTSRVRGISNRVEILRRSLDVPYDELQDALKEELGI